VRVPTRCFGKEFHVLSRIAHPNVVVVYEYGFDAGRPFYTMELVRGRALGELAPLPWQQLCAILIDLCSPLSMLHARRFVHCDVTARNVLVTESGQAKLIDFGALTRSIDRPRRSGHASAHGARARAQNNPSMVARTCLRSAHWRTACSQAVTLTLRAPFRNCRSLGRSPCDIARARVDVRASSIT